MKIKLLHPNAMLPTRGSYGAGAYDLYMTESSVITVGFTCSWSLGIAVEIPAGYGGFIIPRSGVGTRHGLRLLNGTGLIDEDYRGEISATFEVTRADLSWSAGDKLFQMAVLPVYQGDVELVDELDETIRGIGGFGSTGK